MQYYEYYDQQLQYIYQLYHQQNSEIQSLKKQLDDMQSSMEQLPNHGVDTIEYKFDQLKIENLNGTLHIGLSPENLENMDGLGDLQQNNGKSVMPGVKQNALTEISNHLYRNGPQIIHSLAEKYQYPVDQSYATFMLQDIEKQLPARISHHIEQAEKNGKTQKADIHRNVLDSLKKEIDHSLSGYFQKQKQSQSKGDEG